MIIKWKITDTVTKANLFYERNIYFVTFKIGTLYLKSPTLMQEVSKILKMPLQVIRLTKLLQKLTYLCASTQ